MAAADTTVKRIEIRASTSGIDQARSQTSNLEQSLNAVAAANERLAAAFSQAAAANDNFASAQEKANRSWTQSARDLLTWLDVWERIKGSVKGGEETFHSVASAVGATNLALRAMGVAFAPLVILSRALFAVGAGIEILQRAASDFDKMIAAGERAEKLDISAGFVQGFEKISTAARLSDAAMGKALDNAAMFVRDTFGETNKLVQLISDIQDKIGGARLAASKALELPTNTEDRLRIAADAMRELEARGERLAALKIAESMGLGELADKLRAGQMSMAELADAVERIPREGGLNEAAQRALELHRAIEQTKQEIDDAVSVSFNLSSIHEGILNVWLSILTVVKNVVQLFNDGVSYLASWGVQLGKVYDFINKTLPILSAITAAKNFLAGGDQPLTVDVNKSRIGARTIANPVVPPDAGRGARAAQEAADEFEQMIKRIEDTTRKAAEQGVTYGQGAAEAARYRAEQELLTAAERAGREKTADLIAQIKDLSDKAGAAAGELAKIKITKDIGFDRDTALLSDSERNIAEKLKPVYGNDVQASLKSAEADQMRTTDAIKTGWNDAKRAVTDFSTSFVSDMAHGVKAAEAMANAMKKVGDSLIQAGITKGITSALSGDVVGAALGAAEAGVGFLLNSSGPSEKSKQRKQQMMDAWAKQQQDDFDAIQKQQQAVIDAGIASAKASQQAAEEAARQAEEAIRKAEEISRRIEGFQDRTALAGIDTTTISGQLAAFDIQAQRQREEEVRAGGEALVELEEALYAERERIVRDYVDQAIVEEKRRYEEARQFLDQFARTIKQFVDNLKAGAQSPLSPADRLAQAQAQYNAQLALAQGGNRDALTGITGYASNLLDAAKAFYASTSQFQNIFANVTNQLTALPGQVTPEQLIVDAIGSQTKSLSDILNELDTNGDGMISRQEAANTFLDSIFNELDTNGDGQLDKLELIRGFTQGTNNDTSSIGLNTTTANDINTTNQSILNAISLHTEQLATIQQQLQTLYNTTAKTSNNAARVANNTMYSANQATNSSVGIAGDFTYARGGWVYGTGTGLSDSIAARLSNGEFVVRASQAREYAPQLEAINSGRGMNDNDALVGEVRSLRAELTQLRSDVQQGTRATVAGAQYVREGVDQTASAQSEVVRDAKLESVKRRAA
jgi:hypothetical protein